MGAIHPSLWAVGLLGLLGLVIFRPNPLLIIILVIAGLELRTRWRMRSHPENESYYSVTPRQRAVVALLYFGLAALLVLGMHETHVPRSF